MGRMPHLSAAAWVESPANSQPTSAVAKRTEENTRPEPTCASPVPCRVAPISFEENRWRFFARSGRGSAGHRERHPADDAELQLDEHGFGARGHRELVVDETHVGSNGVDRHAEHARDVVVTEAARELLENGALAQRQRLDGGPAARALRRGMTNLPDED